jgi:hypothetical protein
VKKFEEIAKQVDKDENGREFIRVSYFRVGPEPYNRRYAAQASLQGLEKLMMRQIVKHENLVDFDIYNCHPSMFLGLLGIQRSDYPTITRYVVHERDEMLDEIVKTTGCLRENAKDLFVQLLNSGGIPSWKQKHDISGALPRCVYNFKDEVSSAREFVLNTKVAKRIYAWWKAEPQETRLLKKIQQHCKKHHKPVPESLDEADDLVEYCVKNTVFSYTLSYYEDKCIVSMEGTAQKTSDGDSYGRWSVETLKFDGAHFRFHTPDPAPEPDGDEFNRKMDEFSRKMENDCIAFTKCSAPNDEQDYFDLTDLFKLKWTVLGKKPSTPPRVAEEKEEEEEKEDED